MKRNILKSLIVSALLSVQSLASKFNTNVSAPHVKTQVYEPQPGRKKGYRTGIKGIANTNNTEFGANLKAHFDSKRKQAKAAA